jgi:hypothetical protein
MDLKAKSYVGHGDLGCDKMKAHMEEAFIEFTQSPCIGGRSRAQRKLGQKTVFIKLPSSAKKLLKEGRNVLAVRADLPPISNWSHGFTRIVDVGLGVTKIGGGTFGYEVMVKGE